VATIVEFHSRCETADMASSSGQKPKEQNHGACTLFAQHRILSIFQWLQSSRTYEEGDPAPFNEGIVARARVTNNLHKLSLPLSGRSAGFVWFFSFLVKFAQVQKTAGNLILLLDEPSLTTTREMALFMDIFQDRYIITG
jgi:hypothetical protein